MKPAALLLGLLLTGCAGPVTPALIGAGLAFGASALDFDTVLAKGYLCARHALPECQAPVAAK